MSESDKELITRLEIEAQSFIDALANEDYMDAYSPHVFVEFAMDVKKLLVLAKDGLRWRQMKDAETHYRGGEGERGER